MRTALTSALLAVAIGVAAPPAAARPAGGRTVARARPVRKAPGPVTSARAIRRRATSLRRPAAGTPRAWARRLAEAGGPLLIALDIDGVLAPIVKRPDGARIPAATRRALLRLARLPGVELAFITGRSADSAERMLAGLPGWRAVGHGLVVYRGGEPAPEPEVGAEQAAALADFRGWIAANLPAGVRVEDKPTSTALHFRELDAEAPAEARRLFQVVKRAAAARSALSVRDGRMVIEVGVLGHKDQALLAIAEATGAGTVAFAGDDVTDEPAIRAAAGAGGVGLFVRSGERGGPPPGASGTLSGTRGVARWLDALGDELSAGR